MIIQVIPGPELHGPLGDAVLRLLTEHLVEMHKLSPPGSVFALDTAALRSPSITMWSAWEDEHLMGCGALKELSTAEGEIKSMKTATGSLRRGVGSAILRSILDEAHVRSYKRVLLETGSTDAFAAAIGLYERHGFSRRGRFGDYPENPFSLFMELAL